MSLWECINLMSPTIRLLKSGIWCSGKDDVACYIIIRYLNYIDTIVITILRQVIWVRFYVATGICCSVWTFGIWWGCISQFYFSCIVLIRIQHKIDVFCILIGWFLFILQFSNIDDSAADSASLTVRQKMPWQMMKRTHSINIRDIGLHVVPFCSVYQAPSFQPRLSLLSPVSTKLDKLSMSVLLQLACTAYREV